MVTKSNFKMATMVGALLLLAACAREPYIFNAQEFNRDDPNFAKKLTDRQSVEICYTSQTTTPAALLKLAGLACGEFGKNAVFNSQDTLICPILTPSRAIFSCVTP
ncbi:MAG: hypothetical protein O3A84_08075 [Proteobacteria bacterium]|nr:hypothetical protein [Pseudomonadota bacterium]